MASTHLSLHYHLVFGTRNREPVLAESWRGRLHDYMGGTVEGLGGVTQGVGGVTDHVHLLVGLNAVQRLSDIVRELKKASSRWVREEVGLSSFAWQEGYAAFTVGASARAGVRRYIARQQEHHRTKSFREEWIALLDKAGVPYDPRYLD